MKMTINLMRKRYNKSFCGMSGTLIAEKRIRKAKKAEIQYLFRGNVTDKYAPSFVRQSIMTFISKSVPKCN